MESLSVFLSLSDPILADRIASMLAREACLDIVADDRLADVVIADHPGPFAAAAVILDDDQGNRFPAHGNVRAVLPSAIDAELLLGAIRLAAAGFTIAQSSESADEPGTALTMRETEVLSLLAHGASNKSIALRLDISVHTAKFHVASVLAKLGARNRSDAVAIGMRRGHILL